MTGEAVYRDLDSSSTLNGGDCIIVRFDLPVVVLQNNAAAFRLPVAGDSLGAGASIVAGPAADQVTIVLGNGASFRTRQIFANGNTTSGSASGIEIDPAIPPGTIQSAAFLTDAVNSGPVDLVPGLVLSTNVLDSGATRAAVIADIDGNGAPDLFSQRDGAGLSLWENANGDGNFYYFGYQVGGMDVGAFVVADFDKDGDPDVVTTTAAGSGFALYLNQGSWNFTLGPTAATGGISEMQAGDINGDGYLDVVCAAGVGVVNLNNAGGASWQSLPGFGSGLSPKTVALADVDGDGDLDVALGSQIANTRVFLNNGFGSFTWTGQDLGLGTVLQVRFGDLDKDGNVDLCKFIQDVGIEIWAGLGDGSFQFVGTTAAGLAVRKGLLHDQDGDGDLDISFADHNFGLRVLRNSGTGFGFTLLDEEHGRSAGVWLAEGDVDRDGDSDLVVGSDNHPKRVWLNSLSGTSGAANWTEAVPTLPPEMTHLIATGDIDGDGDLDFVAALENKPTRVLKNDGAGNFTTSQTMGPAEKTRAVALADIDRDGDLDCVTGTWDNLQPTRVWINNGSGFFAAGQTIYGETTIGIVLADIDGDGDNDLVTINDGVSRVRFNNGAGTFFYTGIALGNFGARGAAAGDLDRDGDLDLVVTSIGMAQSNHVYFNLGNGYLVDSHQVLDTMDHWSVELADFDGDGDLDMVEGNVNAPSAPKVYLNDGLGMFLTNGQTFPVQSSQSVATGDVDGDGDIDLVFGNNSNIGVPNQVWLNDGLGQFVDSTLALGNYKTSCVRLVDVDRDGDLDLLESVDNAGPVRVWFHH